MKQQKHEGDLASTLSKRPAEYPEPVARKEMMRVYSEEALRQIARIMGESSSSADAIAELDRRRAAGERVTVYESVERGQRYWLVGPDVRPLLDDATDAES